MLEITSFAARQRLLAATCLSAVLVVGCATGQAPPTTAPEPPAVEQPAPVTLEVEQAAATAEIERLEAEVSALERNREAEVSALERNVAELQLRLLDSDARVTALQSAVAEAIMEAVRSKAKLQSVESRAEAASTMAEAEIALRTRQRTEQDNPRVAQAAQLLEMSAGEFDNENYGGALYLATQAKDQISDNLGQRAGTDAASRPDEVPFYFSLPLEVTRSSNVRQGPGTSFGVSFVMEAGTQVMGHAYERQWVRISSEDGRSGWIYSTLVTSR